ncbi:hypothetical protein AB0O01_10870 [Streptomyces sp. NPDC093252]|uniref:hypothetical protein n=1 Tax=Streptomyces sp. NPDC093252 TaxID=3154980 RepID=UPI00343B0D7D
MEPISVALLAALAGGAGGELGREAWAGLSALVRRPFRREDTPALAADGEPEADESALARVAEAPEDRARVQVLSAALAARAAQDPEFAAALSAWHDRARQLHTGQGSVSNTISGGTFDGPVIQGRDYHGGITLSATPPPAAGPDPGEARG